jgi:hypothetical protein
MKRNMANGREVMSAEMGFIMPAVDWTPWGTSKIKK